MSKILKGNAVIGQSGGPTVVINQSLVGVIEAARSAAGIKKLLGARHGVRGMKNNDFVDLGKLAPALLARIAATPAAALGSTRDKPNDEYCQEIFKVFAANDVRYFFYIGGNDSADTARICSELAVKNGYELRVFHIPKTIDNDLRVTDHCPGYGSAARFVACAMMGDDRDNASLPGIKIDVIMGRNAGWLTAASALARADETDGPHLIYVPERPFSIARFIADVDKVYTKYGRCLVAVSEGVADEKTGKPVAEVMAEKLGKEVERDSHGNVQLSGSGTLGDFLSEFVKKELGEKRQRKLRVRADTFGYLQRSFAGFASPIDAKEARDCGRQAVAYAMAGCASGSVAMRRKKGAKYGVELFRAELKDVARETKPMPKEFLAVNGHDVTPAFLKYVRPLVGELPELGKIVGKKK
jgi:6-phosphofructokinase 1